MGSTGYPSLEPNWSSSQWRGSVVDCPTTFLLDSCLLSGVSETWDHGPGCQYCFPAQLIPSLALIQAIALGHVLWLCSKISNLLLCLIPRVSSRPGTWSYLHPCIRATALSSIVQGPLRRTSSLTHGSQPGYRGCVFLLAYVFPQDSWLLHSPGL